MKGEVIGMKDGVTGKKVRTTGMKDVVKRTVFHKKSSRACLSMVGTE